ncbi:MAG TPA: EamA family transporter [Clostridia bacterium]|nr:EamA family transporter [Clostridia bacterium]
MKGYLLVLAAGILWGSLGILGKYLYGYGIDPLTVVTFRALFAFLGLLIIVIIKFPSLLKIKRSDLLFFALFGLISVTCFYTLYFYTVRLTDVATAAVLLYTAPAFVTLLSAKIFKERITKQKLISLFSTFLGCLFVVKAYNFAHLRLSYLGIITGLGSGFTYALFSIFGKKGLEKYNEWIVLFYAFAFGTIFFLIVNNPIAAFRSNYPLAVWLLLLALALGPTLLANFFYTSGLKYIEASKASILATVEPVIAALLAYFLLKERLEVLQLLGIILVIGGVVFTKIARQQMENEQKKDEKIQG